MTINLFETNNSPIVARTSLDGIILEVCINKIPDVFRLLRFDPIQEFELPDTKVKDQEFNKWLVFYRNSSNWFERLLLEESQCN